MACLNVKFVFKEVDGSEGSDSGLVSFHCGNVVCAAGFQKVIDLLHGVLFLLLFSFNFRSILFSVSKNR